MSELYSDRDHRVVPSGGVRIWSWASKQWEPARCSSLVDITDLPPEQRADMERFDRQRFYASVGVMD